MRTKSLMTAGALAMLMAACSNEELQVANNQLNENRPLAGDVVLTPAVDGESSRAVFNMNDASWSFSDADDKFAAMLMDNWDMQGEGIEHYTFVDHIHTNYPFVSEDGGKSWKSVAGAPLCEGNYFFTYPYDPTLTSRGNVYFELETEQTNEEDGVVDPVIAVKKYQRYLGYAFVKGGEGVNEVSPMFHSLFANPKFKIQNGSGVPLRIIKLIIRTSQNGPADTPELMPTITRLAPFTASFAAVNKAYAAGELINDKETLYSKKYKGEIAALFSHATTVQDGFFGADKTKGTYEYVITCGNNYIVPVGENIRLSAVMPAGEYHNFDVYAFVEMQNTEKTTGVVSLTKVGEPSWTGMDTQSGSMQTVLKPGITQVYTAGFDYNAIRNLSMKDFAVVSSGDMEFILKLKATNSGRDMVTIKTLGDGVEMTKEIYALMKAEERAGIKVAVDGIINIPADAEADAINLLATDANDVETTIINYGAQTLSKTTYNCNIENYGTIAEAAGVAATINGNVINGGVKNGVEYYNAVMNVSTINGNVYNYGKIVVTNMQGGEVKNYEGAEMVIGSMDGNQTTQALRNWGTVTINNTTGTTGISNKMGATLNLAGGEVYHVCNRGGIVNVNGATEIGQLYNDGGTLNVNADLKATNAVNGGVLNNGNAVDGEINATATINVAANASLKGGKIQNLPGDVINVKGMLVDGVYNDGTINVIEDGIVIVENFINVATMGTIDVTAANIGTAAQAAKCKDATHQYFAYTVGTEKTNTELGASLKARISSENYGKAPIKLTWAATSATEYAGDITYSNVTDVTINNNLVITGNTKMANVKSGKFIVAKNAGLTVAANATFTLLDNTNIIVNGTLKANNHSKLAGTVSVCGEGLVIIETAKDNCTWSANGTFTGEWHQ